MTYKNLVSDNSYICSNFTSPRIATYICYKIGDGHPYTEAHLLIITYNSNMIKVGVDTSSTGCSAESAGRNKESRGCNE